MALQAFQRSNHLTLSCQGCTPCVRPEFAPTGKGSDHHGTEEHENNLQNENRGIVAKEGEALAFPLVTRAGNDAGNDACQKHDKGVNDALEQGHCHHISVRNVCKLVPKHTIALVRFHPL
jgi:hypothetical protein